MSSFMARASSSADVVFVDGSYEVATVSVPATSSTTNREAATSPPKPLFIAYPSIDGNGPAKFGVMLLLHGFMLRNTFYSQLMQHVASHGFIVVAPQLYFIAGSDSTNDIKAAAEVTDWIQQGSLDEVLPSNVTPDLTRVALSGHSRGGRDAFALALGVVASCSLELSALIGIDPVAGTAFGETNPKILNRHAFDGLHNMPVMVIGSGIDAEKGSCLSCTPKGVNYASFHLKYCKKPSCYFVVKGQGHLDVLDDDTRGIIGTMSYYICNRGSSREPMRRFVGGALVAYLYAYLEKDNTYLNAFRDGSMTFPVEFDAVDFQIL